MPNLLWWGAILGALLASSGVYGIIGSNFPEQRWPLRLMVLGVVFFIAGLIWYYQIKQVATKSQAKATDPAVVTELSEGQSMPDKPQNPLLANQAPVAAGDIIDNQGIVILGPNSGTNTIIRTPKPELKTIDETLSDNADGTYNLNRTVEVNPPYSGNLIITVKADGLVRATVTEGPQQVELPNGNTLTITGGGMLRNVTEVEGFYSATVPTPSGRYVITVITKRKTHITIDTKFQ